jgi:hypothetical protein
MGGGLWGDRASQPPFPSRSTTSISSVEQSLLLLVILKPNACRVSFRCVASFSQIHFHNPQPAAQLLADRRKRVH